MAADAVLFHECGHFIIETKFGNRIDVDIAKDFKADPDKVEHHFAELMGNWMDSLGAPEKKPGPKSMFSREEIAELKHVHQTTRPRDHGIGIETRGEGWVWTVDLFRALMQRLHPDKHFSRATAGRYHRLFKRKRS